MTDKPEMPIKDLGWRELAARWLLAQGVSTVLLFSILFFIGYAVLYMVPSHLSTIQEGYEKIEMSNEKQLDRLLTTQEKQIDTLILSQEKQMETVTSTFKDTLDRIEMRHQKDTP